MQDGFLLVDKPEGMTSHDVVAKARRLLGIKKIGHSGTLDPLASGLLVLGVGAATKKLATLKGDKTYLATIRLGATSETDDREGPIEVGSVEVKCNRPEIEAVLEGFVGLQEQIPPIYSAIKINGQKAYDIARSGGSIEMKPRQITVHSIEITGYESPDLSVKIVCSPGTYIRSLARDIGQKLGVGGYLLSLRRTSSDGFGIDQSCQLEEIDWSKVASI